jgi:peptide/nickel transport system substrate-binding protein
MLGGSLDPAATGTSTTRTPLPLRLTSRRDVLRSVLGGAAAVTAGSVLTACSNSAPAAVAAAPQKARMGGSLRVAITGGTPADSLDGDQELNQPECIRNTALYNGLVALDTSAKQVVLDLAEELTPSADAMSWTIRLRPDVVFHNGKPLTVDDLIFTFRRILNPQSPLNGAAALAPLDMNQIKVLDKLTLRVNTLHPFATFPEQIADSFYFGIVPVGYDPRNPVGTGPFRFKSFSPGIQSVFVRNPSYYKHGLPYLDELTIIDSFQDYSSAYDALVSGAVDVYTEAPFEMASQANSAGLKVVVDRPGQWNPFVMRTDAPPFNDVRVRQAFRLMIDRSQMVKQAIDGYGIPGNDLFSIHDPCYDTSLHRTQDIEQAKFLLKQAGQENLSIQLMTANLAPGMIENAQVLAQQAMAAGVTIGVRELTVNELFGPNYLKWVFAVDSWGYSPYVSQIAQSVLPTAPYNETHFNNPRYFALYNEANATLDAVKRCEILHEMQQIDFSEGGYIVPMFQGFINLMNANVNGVLRGGTGIPLGNGNWEVIWVS